MSSVTLASRSASRRTIRNRFTSARALCTILSSRRSSGWSTIVASVERIRAGVGLRGMPPRPSHQRRFISTSVDAIATFGSCQPRSGASYTAAVHRYQGMDPRLTMSLAGGAMGVVLVAALFTLRPGIGASGTVLADPAATIAPPPFDVLGPEGLFKAYDTLGAVTVVARPARSRSRGPTISSCPRAASWPQMHSFWTPLNSPSSFRPVAITSCFFTSRRRILVRGWPRR